VFVRYRLNCRRTVHGSSSSDSTLELRYRYLGHFTHSQTLDLPAALTIIC
jgi:hypothetical protein